jgi:hypothetical protein
MRRELVRIKTSLGKIMKIKTAFALFAIFVLSFIYLRSGTATNRQARYNLPMAVEIEITLQMEMAL